jgi:hypothetical protein
MTPELYLALFCSLTENRRPVYEDYSMSQLSQGLRTPTVLCEMIVYTSSMDISIHSLKRVLINITIHVLVVAYHHDRMYLIFMYDFCCEQTAYLQHPHNSYSPVLAHRSRFSGQLKILPKTIVLVTILKLYLSGGPKLVSVHLKYLVS